MWVVDALTSGMVVHTAAGIALAGLAVGGWLVLSGRVERAARGRGSSGVTRVEDFIASGGDGS